MKQRFSGTINVLIQSGRRLKETLVPAAGGDVHISWPPVSVGRAAVTEGHTDGLLALPFYVLLSSARNNRKYSNIPENHHLGHCPWPACSCNAQVAKPVCYRRFQHRVPLRQCGSILPCQPASIGGGLKGRCTHANPEGTRSSVMHQPGMYKGLSWWCALVTAVVIAEACSCVMSWYSYMSFRYPNSLSRSKHTHMLTPSNHFRILNLVTSDATTSPLSSSPSPLHL